MRWPVPGRLRPAAFALAVAALAGCADETSPTADRVATYRGGVVTLRDAEEQLRRGRGPGAGGEGVDALLATYRQAAEAVAIDRLLAGEATTAAALAELGPLGREIRRQVLAEAFLASRPGSLAVTPAEIGQYYAKNRERFQRPAQRNVWHLFRRHRDPARPEETIAFLEELRRRARGGEGFGQLAQQYSDSETRALGGRLGIIGKGRLPKTLEEAVFALPAGGISAPIPIASGAMLFHVSDVIEERRFALEDVREPIAAHLAGEKRRARIAELVSGRELPAGSVRLDPDALVRAVAGPDPKVVVLAVGEDRLTAGELRERIEKEAAVEEDEFFAPTPRERLERTYRDLVHEHLLLLAAEEAGVGAAPPSAADRRIAALAREALVSRRLEGRMRERAGGDEGALRRFHSDNRHLYQTPLRFRLHTLSVAADPAAPRRMAELEELRRGLVAGTLDLPAAAARIGGTVTDLGWVDFEALAGWEPKVRFYVLDLGGAGFTVPFQLNRRLSLIRVEAREEPREQPFEKVRERVLADFFARNRPALQRATVEALLSSAEFRFHEENVRRVLAPPAAAGSASSGAPAGR